MLWSRGSKRYTALWWRLNRYLHPFFDPCEDPHPHTLVDGIELDVQIAGLVQWIWSSGVPTANSCQGDPVLETLADRSLAQTNPHTASITFLSLGDARWFAAVLSRVVSDQPRVNGSRISIEFDPTDLSPVQEYFHVSFSSWLLLEPSLIGQLNVLR